MKFYATTDLQRNLGEVLVAANKKPVMIIRHNKGRYVLMTVEDYEQLKAQASKHDTTLKEPKQRTLPKRLPMATMPEVMAGGYEEDIVIDDASAALDES